MTDEPTGYRLSPKIKQKFRQSHVLKEEVKTGKTGQEILEFSDEVMAKFYEVAYHLFENKNFSQAAQAFLFLAALNPSLHEYWLGLGMSLQMCHDYEEAIDAYELAALCDLASPVPYFYLAKCLFAIHDRTSALQAVDLAIEMANENEEYAELKQQAIAARQVLLESE